MKFKGKKIGRTLSALLAAAMIITSTPQSLLTVQAAESVTQNTTRLSNDVGAGISADVSETAQNTRSVMDNNTETTQASSVQEDTEPANPTDTDEVTQPTSNAATTENSSDGTASESGESASADEETRPAEPATSETSPTTPAEEAVTPGDNTDNNAIPTVPTENDTVPTESADNPDDTGSGIIPDKEVTASTGVIIFNFLQKGFPTIKKKFPAGSPIEMTEALYTELHPELDGYCLMEWCRNEDFTGFWDFDLDTVPSGSLTLYAHWVTAYDVTFDLQGKGTNFIWKNVGENFLLGEASEELHPTAEGFRFDGWYRSSECNESEKWNFDTDRITGPTTLYAKWTPLGSNTVTYNLQGHGEDIVQKYIPDGPLDPANVPTPADKGYRFLGWYKSAACADDEKWDFEIDKIAGDITLYAKWEEVFYTVSFDLLGHGTAIDSLKLKEGALIEKTEALQPTAESCHFEGWYREYNAETKEYSGIWDFASDTVTEDITLYAKWHELAADEYIITFNLSGHGADFYRYLTADSKIDAADIAQPDDDGYRLTGWYKDAACAEADRWNFDTDTVTANTILYAKWEEITYTVTFDLQGKGTNFTKSGLKPGALIPQTEDLKAEYLQTTVSGSLFMGWYKDAACTEAWNFDIDMVQQDIILYAKWQPCYTVTFDLRGHGANIVKTIPEGGLIEQTPDLQPTAEGYHFENWYKGYNAQTDEYTDIWNFNTDTVTADTTLYAKWKQLEAGEFVVTFDLNDHGTNFFQYVTEGSKIEKPADPEDDGYLFLDWYNDSALKIRWNFEKDTVTSHMTLYAKWKDISTLHVAAIEPVPYTGKAIKPAVSVYAYESSSSEDDGAASSVLLKNGKDYTVKYFNNTNTNALLLAQGIESGTCQAEDTPEGGNNTTGEKGIGGFNPALPYILIEGKGVYEGKIYMNFVISQISIGDENNNTASGITLKCNDQLSTGIPKKDQKTITSLKYKAALRENSDYTASITVGDNVISGSVIPKDSPIWGEAGGDCTLTITGIGNYTGTIVKPIIVRAKNVMLGNATLSLGAKCKSKPLSSAGEDGVTLIPAYYETEEEDMYDRNDEPILDKDGNIKTKKVTHYYQYINGSWVEYEEYYNEKTDEDATRPLNKANAFTVKLGGEWLVYGNDFDIQYTNNTAVGTATMTIVGKGAYCGSKSVNFKITGKAFNASTVTFAKDDEGGSGWISKFVYDGTEKTQSVTLESKKRTKVYDCGYENGEEEEYYDKNDNLKTRKHRHNANCEFHVDIDHTFGADEYTVTYVNNVKVGTATAIFTANPASGYSGRFKKTFKITGINMAEFVTFNGPETLTPSITDEDVEVNTGKKDEDGEPITTTKHIHKVNTTRYMEGSVPYVKSGATLNFYLTSEGSEEPLVLNRDYTISYKNNKRVTPYKTRKWRDKWLEYDENDKPYWEYGEWEEESNPVDSKMGALVITGKGNYSGKMTIKYVITQGTMDDESAVVTVARSEYNPNTKEYKPKVTVWTENAGYLSAKEFTVKYENNKKADVAEYLENGGPAPTATVTLKKNSSYTNLSDTKDEDGKVEEKYDDNPITLAPATLQFFNHKLTAKNLYIIIDNDDPRDLVYTGSQVTNVDARVYYGDPAAIKAAQKDQVTNHRLLTLSADQGGSYGLQLLTQADEEQNGDYTVTYGKNNAIGRNKGSITINGIGEYGGSVTQKFTIYRKPVSYTIMPVTDE